MKFFDKTLKKNTSIELPMVPLRDTVVFPGMVVPFFAGKTAAIKAIEKAMAADRKVYIVCQTGNTLDTNNLSSVGTVAHILQLMKLPDGTSRVLIEGQYRASHDEYNEVEGTYSAKVTGLEESEEITSEHTTLMRAIHDSFKKFTNFHKKIPSEIVASISKTDNPEKLVNLLAANIPLPTEKKLIILKSAPLLKRLQELAVIIESEIEVLDLQKNINSRVKQKMEKTQREFFLNEQLKEINKELGKGDDYKSDAEELEEKFKSLELPDEVELKAKKEMKRLEKLQPISPEAGIVRTYLEWLSDLPWNKQSDERLDIDEAKTILDTDHYNMKEPKERILEFIGVRKLQNKLNGPILCFVGPPGTGKTSLGKSVARALNREFVRISLGGVRDEAEIRGHRRTYVGALPGKIIQSIKKAGTKNPVFLLDEIDKMSSDYRGDPAAALLEVLDPEQNSSFADHYLEVPFDLSDVLFITTANSLHNIPLPLRDRMEVIEIPGYSEFEKIKIAEGFIIPKALKANGLEWADIKFNKSALEELIRNYTMESGVRSLERTVSRVVRKIVQKAVKAGFSRELIDADPEKAVFKSRVTKANVETYLGKPRYKNDVLYTESKAGVANGLAWTEVGGRLLPVEVSILPGKGELILTGSLGDVMKESARIALSYIKSNAHQFKLQHSDFEKISLHVHVPAGAIPKDGPSAGITLVAAMLSRLSGISVKGGIAMTGEVTLTGRVLAIGGVKEKTLAAVRNSMQTVLMPGENKADAKELSREIQSLVDIKFADNVQEALTILFPDDLFA